MQNDSGPVPGEEVPPERAGAVADINPYARPTHLADEAQPPPGQAPAKKVGLARRLAGGAMILNGVLLLLDIAFGNEVAPVILPGIKFIPAALDLVIGATLILGYSKLATFAIVRAALGLTAGIALRNKEGGPFDALLQLALAGGMLGLLVSEAGRVRTAVAGGSTGIAIAVQMLVAGGGAVGWYPFAVTSLRMSGDIEPSPVTRVEGRTAPYEITFPEGVWYERTQGAVAKEGVSVDRWFLRPNVDAAVMVVAEKTEGATPQVDPYVDAVFSNIRKDFPGIQVGPKEPWPVFPQTGRLVPASTTAAGIDYEYMYAFVTAYERGYYVVAYAPRSAMPSLDAELRGIIGSFRLPPSVLDAVPPDLDPAPITTVAGRKSPYSFTAPGGLWRLRRHEVVDRENPAVDQWISRPDVDAHVMIVAEQLDSRLDLHWFVETVIALAKKDTSRFDVVLRGPWARFPEHGVRLHLSLVRNDVEIEYEYGLWLKGGRAYQIMAFTSKARYDAARDEMIAAVDSFVPAP